MTVWLHPFGIDTWGPIYYASFYFMHDVYNTRHPTAIQLSWYFVTKVRNWVTNYSTVTFWRGLTANDLDLWLKNESQHTSYVCFENVYTIVLFSAAFGFWDKNKYGTVRRTNKQNFWNKRSIQQGANLEFYNVPCAPSAII